MQEGVLWKFLELKEAGHSDIDTEYSDELLDTLVDFVQYLTPKDVLSQQQKQAALVPSNPLAALSIRIFIFVIFLTPFCEVTTSIIVFSWSLHLSINWLGFQLITCYCIN